MDRLIAGIFRCFTAVARIRMRLYRYLLDRADRQVTAWSASLQMRRRYTHPDEAKRYRRNA